MTIFKPIPIDRVLRGPSSRELFEDNVLALKESIGSLGQLNPITVRKVGESYQLVAGGHRLEACHQLGETQIDCIVIKAEDLEAELATIDENLCRAQLSSVERSQQMARRKVLYEELHPETRHGAVGGGRPRSRQLGVSEIVDRFTADTAAATGKSERPVQRDAERGENITDKAAELIRGTQLDTGVFQDEIKDRSPEDQLQRVRAELGISNDSQSDGTAAKRSAGRRRLSDVPPADKIQTFMKLADRMERLNVAEMVEASSENPSLLGPRVARLITHLNGILEELEAFINSLPVSSVSTND